MTSMFGCFCPACCARNLTVLDIIKIRNRTPDNEHFLSRTFTPSPLRGRRIFDFARLQPDEFDRRLHKPCHCTATLRCVDKIAVMERNGTEKRNSTTATRKTTLRWHGSGLRGASAAYAGSSVLRGSRGFDLLLERSKRTTATTGSADSSSSFEGAQWIHARVRRASPDVLR